MVSRRARWAACSEGQRSRNAAKTSVSLSRNQSTNLRKVVLERERQPVSDPDAVLDQVTSRLDEPPEGAHVVALTAKRRELLRMTAQQLERQRRVGRVVLGAARDEGTTVRGERARIHGEDDEELVLEQRRHDRSLGELEAHGDGATSEAFTELARPGVNDSWTVFEHGSLAIGRTRDLKADVVLAVGPVDADEGRELGRLFLHGNLLDLGSGRDMQSRAQRRQYGEPVKAAFPECSLRAKAHPRAAKPS